MEQQHIHEDSKHNTYMIEHNHGYVCFTYKNFTHMAKFEPCFDKNYCASGSFDVNNV